jgi:amino acid adenylation domain-containing protein
LIRATLLQLAPTESLLLLTYHHIVADGWSKGILVNELKALYSAFVAGQPSPLADLSIQYADFAVWQAEWLHSLATPDAQEMTEHQSTSQEGQKQTLLTKQLQYWRQQLAGPLPVLELPTDHPRPPIQTFHGAHLTINIPERLMDDLQVLSQREGVTLFMTLLASFQLLLARYSGQEDILTGSPSAGRTRAETEALVGFFVNALVLRTNFAGNPTFQDVLQRVREVCLAAYAHQEVPFEQVVEAVYPTRDLSRSPLFQVMFGLHDAAWWLEADVAGLQLRQVEIESNISVFDITWSVMTSGFGIVEYNTDLFEESTIARMLEHWYELLRAIVARPELRLAEIPLLTATEQEQILYQWNETQHFPPQLRCLHQLFEEQVRLNPTAIALKTSTVSLTYQEVERRANKLAHALWCLGLPIGGHVGVCMSKVPEAIISLLAILKAGGVYVPLDPHYPQERLAFMAADVGLFALLTQRKVRHCLPALDLPTLYIESDWFQESTECTEPLAREVVPEQIAYIIYTSGSTGRPKGVQVSHQGIYNLVEVQKRNFALRSGDRVLQFSSLSFDASIWEICMSICTGATLCLGDEDVVMAGQALEATLARLAITVVTLPPSILASLSTTALPQLRTIIVAGEACPAELVASWASGRRFFNAYGPTEATVCATLERCTDGTCQPAIGRPIENTQMYVLDPSLRPVPIGVAGELYIGGIGLAYAYLNRPELTAERFVPHPFTNQEGARLYRTGDRGRYRADGSIEFLGRIDEQVKIRGHRIEPGEVEAVLLEHPAVRTCAVVVQKNAGDEPQLVAYVITRAQHTFSSEELRAHLLQRLPEYMLPALLLPLEHMPLTPNGKIDRKNLPDAREIHQQRETTLVLPTTSTERVIASIWQDCLHLEKVGLHENFFELGGHSLLVVQVIKRIQEHFQREVALTDLFEYPTVSAFAKFLDQAIQPANLNHKPASILPSPQEEALRSGQNRLRSRRMLQEKE